MSAAIDWATATEEQLREAEAPSPKTHEELAAFMTTLAERSHDYGTCVYAVSLSAVAAFNLMAHLQGITGFQASCADLDILRRTRSLNHGFRIVDYGKLLYPQHCDSESFPSLDDLIRSEGPRLAEAARKLIDESHEFVHPKVFAHWQKIAALASEPQS